LFRVDAAGVPFLSSDIFMQEYARFGAVAVLDRGVWTSYLPVRITQRTLRAGVELFGRRASFVAYAKSFNAYQRNAERFFRTSLQQATVEADQAQRFLSVAARVFRYYSRTEFFFTDAAAARSENPRARTLRRNLKELQRVKFKGREFLNALLFGEHGYLSRLLHKISRQTRIPTITLRQYSQAELVRLVEGPSVPQSVLRQRRRGFTMLGKRGRVITFVGSTAHLRLGLPLSTPKDSILRGIGVTPGNHRGRVLLVPPDYYFNRAELRSILRRIRRGDVLVAETTSPELLPACRRAGSIVTNQGGLLSHAAIVSRELGIPCVVGTFSATELLRDGDYVEVDATKGIVRRINR
jgi:phosphohistidine swiveling domain-containing protein